MGSDADEVYVLIIEGLYVGKKGGGGGGGGVEAGGCQRGKMHIRLHHFSLFTAHVADEVDALASERVKEAQLL